MMTKNRCRHGRYAKQVSHVETLSASQPTLFLVSVCDQYVEQYQLARCDRQTLSEKKCWSNLNYLRRTLRTCIRIPQYVDKINVSLCSDIVYKYCRVPSIKGAERGIESVKLQLHHNNNTLSTPPLSHGYRIVSTDCHTRTRRCM